MGLPSLRSHLWPWALDGQEHGLGLGLLLGLGLGL